MLFDNEFPCNRGMIAGNIHAINPFPQSGKIKINLVGAGSKLPDVGINHLTKIVQYLNFNLFIIFQPQVKREGAVVWIRENLP